MFEKLVRYKVKDNNFWFENLSPTRLGGEKFIH
jgi:hypothetical protein